MKVFYSGAFTLPLPQGHRFPMEKYGLLRRKIADELPQVAVLPARPASDDELLHVHSGEYVASIVEGSVSAGAMREIGFLWSPAMVERSRRSVGATIAAVGAALEEGVAANMAGGTHHAYADRGSGFCVFNDVAVAVRIAQAEVSQPTGARLDVAVIDLDVHQGNGTAHIFAHDPGVFTLSLHGAKNFPFRKESSDLDVPLPDGCIDAVYMEALDKALDTLDMRFEPGLVFYVAGADPHEGDRLGRLKLSFDGLRVRDNRVFEWCWKRRIPLVMAMGGGYGTDIHATVQVQTSTFAIALAYWQRWRGLAPAMAGTGKMGIDA